MDCPRCAEHNITVAMQEQEIKQIDGTAVIQICKRCGLKDLKKGTTDASRTQG